MSDKFTWMHSGQIGAPQMNGAAGSNGQMLQVLDACLINGFNPQTVTIATKTATTVTLTFGVSHGYLDKQIVSVAGANDAVLNGNHQIVSVTTNTITIDAVGVTVTTGTLVTKIAPLGFESIFGSADPLKRAYRSTDAQSTKTVLYLDMNLPTGHGYNAANPAKRAMISLCEDMTSLGVQINSYTDIQNNYATDVNGNLFWYQARDTAKATAVTDAVNSAWIIVGNSKVFYFFHNWSTISGSRTSQKLRDFYAFGDALGIGGAVDSFNCMWVGAINKNDTTNVSYASNGAKYDGSFPANAIGYFIKPASGVGLMQLFFMVTGLSSTFVSSSGAKAEVALPNPDTQSLVGLPSYAKVDNSFRAEMPRLLKLMHAMGNNYTDYDLMITDGVLIIATQYAGGTAANYGYFAIDLN